MLAGFNEHSMSLLATSPNMGSELEQARPQTSGEEELQLQLALAMSREAAEQVHTSNPTQLCVCYEFLGLMMEFVH